MGQGARPVTAPATTGIKISTVRFGSLAHPDIRLDAKHYQEEFTLATTRVAGCGYDTRPLEDLAEAFVPNRMKLVTTGHPEAGPPYLRAHDAFDTRAESYRYVSKIRTKGYESYLLKEGMLLTPSSGRNLGPLAYVGKKLSRYAMTDIVRIVPKERDLGYYLLAYLLTPTGQALIRRGRTGTTVDHLSPRDLYQIPVIWPDEGVRARIGRQIAEAETLLDEARLVLDDLERDLHAKAGLPLPPVRGLYEPSVGARAFGLTSRELTLRLDAEFYDPTVTSARKAVETSGAAPLGQVAELRLLGRYKRYYVGKEYGRPILSGSQLLQLRPVNLQYISDRSFRDPESFVLHQGWTIFTCDGRAEQALGSPAYVSSLWEGWMASNHVMRAIPKEGMPSGYLYMALRSPYVQMQLKSRATGSVIDALEPDSVEDLLVPMLNETDRHDMGCRAEDAWEQIARAVRTEETAVAELEDLIVAGYETV